KFADPFMFISSLRPIRSSTMSRLACSLALGLPSQLDLGHETAEFLEIPEGDLLVITRGQDSPVRGELKAIDGARVRLQGDESIAGVGVPELEGITGNCEEVPREREGADLPLVGNQPCAQSFG